MLLRIKERSRQITMALIAMVVVLFMSFYGPAVLETMLEIETGTSTPIHAEHHGGSFGR